MKNKALENMTREQLEELIQMYCKNWLAMDGVWFQSVEKKYGMDEAMVHDVNIWSQFTVIEAKKIKAFLGLPERAGLDGLEQALQLRLYANINRDEILREGNQLMCRTLDCRVRPARSRKGMEWHPCKPVGETEYSGFAKVIDDRISCRCISCYPDITDNSCACSWEFTLNE